MHAFQKLFLFTIVCIFLGVRAGNAQTDFPLLGLWEVVEAADAKGASVMTSRDRAEFEFKEDGILVVTAFAESEGMSQPAKTEFQYNYTSPDTYSFTVDGSAHEEYKFEMIGHYVVQKHTQYGTKSIFYRLERSKFGDANIQEKSISEILEK